MGSLKLTGFHLGAPNLWEIPDKHKDRMKVVRFGVWGFRVYKPKGGYTYSNSQPGLPKNKATKVYRVLMVTPNREPHEHRRKRMEYKDLGRYVPTIFWGSLFGVPSNVPLNGSLNPKP